MITLAQLNEGDIVVAVRDIQDGDRLMKKGTVGIVIQCAFAWMGVDFGDPALQHDCHVNLRYDDHQYDLIRVKKSGLAAPRVAWNTCWTELTAHYKNRKRGMKEEYVAF